jgi:hypothetical protein
MAIPAIIGLFRSSVHSSLVKLVLSAIDVPPYAVANYPSQPETFRAP